MLQRLRKVRTDDDRGFTLIELLVVVVIIGVLVAIAIPVYLNYRKGAENTSASSDVRGAISAVEQFYTDNGNVYPATKAGALSTALTLTKITGAADVIIPVSNGNTLSFALATGGASYWICGYNADGGTVYIYNSLSGKSIGKSATPTGSAGFGTCVTSGT